MRKFISILQLILIAAGIFNFQVKSVSADWYDNAWNYRKSHVFGPASGAGNNYQMELTIHYGSGSDSGSDVYLGSSSNSDFSDIRFTDNDETTELDYWIKEQTDSDSATVWVEVSDDMSSASTTIYVYYGNSSASSESSIKQTFAQAIDFSSDTVLSYGGSQDTGPVEWSVDGSENYIRLGENIGRGNHWKAVNAGLLSITSGDYMLEFSYKSDASEGEISGVGHDNELAGIETGKLYQVDGNQSWGLQGGHVTQYDRGTGNWQDMEALLDDYTGDYQYLTIGHDNDSGPTTDDYFRDIRVRKYLSQGPADGAWGAEEEKPEQLSGDTSRRMRLFEGYTIKILSGRVKIQ